MKCNSQTIRFAQTTILHEAGTIVWTLVTPSIATTGTQFTQWVTFALPSTSSLRLAVVITLHPNRIRTLQPCLLAMVKEYSGS